MVLSLALRNVHRNLKRLAPAIATLVVSFLVLTFVNGILAFSNRTFRTAYLGHVTTEFVIAEPTSTSVSLFGPETLLVEELLALPLLRDVEELSERLALAPEVADHSFVVSTPGRVEYGEVRLRRVLFGVSFPDYQRVFPDLNLVAGTWPDVGERAALLQSSTYERLFGTDDFARYLGESILLAGATEAGFALREAKLAGVYAYPADDELLRSIVLVDVGTARDLAGYLRGDSGVPGGTEPALDGDLDALFATESEPVESTAAPEVSLLDEIDSMFSGFDATESTESLPDPYGAWNFALVRPTGRLSQRALGSIAARSSGEPVQILNWRQSIGGNAVLVYVVGLIANSGVLVVMLGAIIVATNALMLSIVERTKELGTMLAIGAQRSKVAAMLLVEATGTVFTSAILGMALGAALLWLVNRAGLAMSNRYLRLLLGGSAVRGTLTPGLVAGGIGLAALLVVASVLYPLARLRRLAPVEAAQA